MIVPDARVETEGFEMRLTPAQVGMSLLLGGIVAQLSTGDLKADIRKGRSWLLPLAGGEDFGYDALRWHEHLWATDAGGYKWGRRSPDKWARHARAGMARPGWAEAVRELMDEDSQPITGAETGDRTVSLTQKAQ